MNTKIRHNDYRSSTRTKEVCVPFRETIVSWIVLLIFNALVTAIVCACIAIVNESNEFSWTTFALAYPPVLGLIYGSAVISESSRYE